MKKLLILTSLALALIGTVSRDNSAEAWIPLEAATDSKGQLLKDGDLISVAGDPDIYIIKFAPVPGLVGYGDLPDEGSLGYKRLFLNPAIFGFYGHLGGFVNVRQVTPRIRDAFTTSGLFRNCETNSQRVWATEVLGEDSGILHHVQVPGDQAVLQDAYFFHKVFCINTREENFYGKSITPYTDVRTLPIYKRKPCIVRPACLDSNPQCLLPEPAEGWCPRVTPTPPPGCYYQEVTCVRAPCNPELVCPQPGPCYVGGCSSQLCTDQPDAVSTCEYRNEYACYSGAECKRQTNGLCGWTQTSQLQYCLNNQP